MEEFEIIEIGERQTKSRIIDDIFYILLPVFLLTLYFGSLATGSILLYSRV